MLNSLGLRSGAVRAKVEDGGGANVVFGIRDGCLHLAHGLVIVKGSVMSPRVEEGDVSSADLSVRHLLGGETVGRIVLALFLEEVESVFEIVFDQVGADSTLELLLVVALLRVAGLPELDGPETGVSEHGAEVDPEGSKEVVVAEVEDVLSQVLEEDTNHPDLLVGDEAGGPLVHSVFAEGGHKSGLKFVHPRVVQIYNLSLVISVDC